MAVVRWAATRMGDATPDSFMPTVDLSAFPELEEPETCVESFLEAAVPEMDYDFVPSEHTTAMDWILQLEEPETCVESGDGGRFLERGGAGNLVEARDLLRELIATTIREGMDLPEPSRAGKRRPLVVPPVQIALKAALYEAYRGAGVSQRRLLDVRAR